MEHELPLLVDIASGILLLALGAFVASVRPRRPGNVAFGVFAASFGMAYGILGVAWGRWFSGLVQDALLLVAAGLAVAAALALVPVARTFPRPLGSADRRLVWTTAGVFAAVFSVNFTQFWADVGFGIDAFRVTFGEAVPAEVFLVSFVAYPVFLSALWAALYLFALRYRAAPRDDVAFKRQLALASAGLVLWHAFWARLAGGGVGFGSGPLVEAVNFGMFLVMLAYAALWLSNTTRGGPTRAARNVAWLTLGGSLAGSVAFILWPDWAFAGGSGLMRLLGVAIFAYAILRHQLLGIDVTVKWTVKQFTVAAVFLAVVFLASEGAQLAFGEDQAWIGLLAGGALVFALAPIQRLAERVSERAMPGVKPVGEMTGGERRRAYLDAARTAWADGAIDRSERALLDRFAESLGLNEAEAHRIEREAAGEAG